MSRTKAEYSLFKPARSRYYHYNFYDSKGRRLQRSTGETSKAAAQIFLNDLIRGGKLAAGTSPVFGAWAADWWVWDKCDYIRSQRGRVGHTHADTQRSYLTRHILPHFGHKQLSKITTLDIERWVAALEDAGTLSASSINHCVACLKVMFREATRLGLVQHDPALSVRKLPEKRPRRDLWTVDEVRALFSPDKIDAYWHGSTVHRTMNMVAAFTGARQGEIRALRPPDVRVDTVSEERSQPYIHIDKTMTRRYGLKDTTKTGAINDVPIPWYLHGELENLISANEADPAAYIFSYDGVNPLANRSIANFLYGSLKRMGISEAERQSRGLTFHAWRHWFNTVLRSRYIPDAKVRALTGHATEAMTERYTGFRLEDFADVAKLQEEMV